MSCQTGTFPLSEPNVVYGATPRATSASKISAPHSGGIDIDLRDCTLEKTLSTIRVVVNPLDDQRDSSKRREVVVLNTPVSPHLCVQKLTNVISTPSSPFTSFGLIAGRNASTNTCAGTITGCLRTCLTELRPPRRATQGRH